MQAKMYSFTEWFQKTFQIRLSRKLTTRHTILLSIALHIIVALAVAAFWVGSQTSAETHDNQGIVFDLESVKPSRTDSGQLQQGAEEYGMPNPEASESSGRAGSLLKGNMNRDAVVTASLASLSQLRETFAFVTQTVSADSIGGFSPLHGDVPGSEYDSFGRKKGEGFGSGNGSITVGGGPAFCPTPRGY